MSIKAKLLGTLTAVALAACSDLDAPRPAAEALEVSGDQSHLAGIEVGGQLVRYFAPNSNYQMLYPTHNNPHDDGTYHVSWYDSRSIEFVGWIGQYETWIADTMFRVTPTHLYYMSNDPNCAFDWQEQQDTPGNSFYPMYNGCRPNTITVHYTVQKIGVQSPLSWYVVGPTRAVRGEYVTWTHNITGGGVSGVGRRMEFPPYQYVTTGGVFCYSNTCGYSVPQNSGNFTVHRTVWTTMHVEPFSSNNVVQHTTIQVEVAAPLTLGGGVSGPGVLDSGQPGTWSISPAGAFPPYSYQWRINGGEVLSTGSSITASFEGFANYDITVDVFDADGRTLNAYKQIYVGGGCNPCELRSIVPGGKRRIKPVLGRYEVISHKPKPPATKPK